MINEHLLRYSDKTFICLDCETESLNLFYSRPWEIAWIVARKDEILEKFCYLIKWPDFKISEDAARITKFNEDEYQRNAKSPKEVYSILSKYLYDPKISIVGHNLLGFDVYQLASLQRAVGAKVDYSYVNRLYDSFALAKAIKLDGKLQKDENLLAFQYRYLNFVKKGLKTSLATLAKEYELVNEDGGFHRALYDVEVNYKIFRKMLWQIEI